MTINSKTDLMTEEEFSLLRDLVSEQFGISIKGDRRLTLHMKVSHRLIILGLETYRQYFDYIISDPTGEELFTLASHLTNKETYFFREKAQLDVFSELLREIKTVRQSRKERVLRVLSLASSSGEEAYSLNILIQENGLFAWDWDVRITGMDIDRNAIGKAREAVYSRNSFRSLNGEHRLLSKYFTVEGDRYILRRSLTRNVDFLHGNIVDPKSFKDIERADAIFCRNVLIYMSDAAISKLAVNFYDCLSDTGYLFIGSAESLIQKTNLFIPEYRHGVIVYRKNTVKKRSA
jgi:chemotaxis protein methyltransferase CheR